MEREKKIGILGGSFDPVHKAHLVLAHKALQKLKLDRVLFIPCYLAPHREGKKVSSPRYRLAMLRRVLRGKKKFLLSLMEMKRKGRSYSIDTLKALRKKYPKGTEFYFIIGSDSWEQLPTWKNFKSLAKLCTFVVFNRKGYAIHKGGGRPQPLKVKMIPVRVSSTEIRDKIRKGNSIEKWVPKTVKQYIQRNQLYKK